MAIDYGTPEGQVRLLLCDVQDPPDQVFTNDQITAFLAMEHQSVKRAAAQAIDTNADNEVLASKVLTTQDLSTDGSKIAAALHARAAALRAQAVLDEEDSDDGFFFDVIDLDPLIVRDPDFPDRTWTV